MNIEKEFYTRIDTTFGECKEVAYHLAEKCALTTGDMERYLIKCEYEEQKNVKGRNKKPLMMVYSDLGEKYSKSIHAIIYIVKKI
jgi:hypothetical protein